MISVDAAQVNEILDYRSLIEHLRAAFRSSSIAVPPRHHHSLPALPWEPDLKLSTSSPDFEEIASRTPLPSSSSTEDESVSGGSHQERDSSQVSGARQVSSNPTLLLMPAWQTASEPGKPLYAGVKYLSVFPDNIRHRLPTISGLFILSSAETGIPLAVMDGTTLTAWRTASASALAADYLARRDAKVLVMVGAGAMAPHLVGAHVAVRPTISEVLIWNRSPQRAIALASHLRQTLSGVSIQQTDDLESAVRRADLVSCATLAKEPVLRGAWLRAGAHVDLVGAFTAATRESDDEVMLRAKGKIYVDTRAGGFGEAGDIVIPLKSGVISAADIVGELAELTRGSVVGRISAKEITVFKSVGTALEDLAAAQLVFERLTQ